MKIRIFTCGGTIDKVYFDAKSTFQVGEPQVALLLKEARVTLSFEVETIFQKDSLEMTEADRMLVRQKVENASEDRILITHGTDTMVETAKMLKLIPDKIIVLTGALAPAKFRVSDAVFNIGCAVTAVQTLPEGVYIAMNGRIFQPGQVRKNMEENRFEAF